LRPKSDSINAAIGSMYNNTTAFKYAPLSSAARRRGNLLVDSEPKPPVRWAGEEYIHYTKVSHSHISSL